VADPKISPDGKRIAFVVTEPADSNKPEKARDDNIWMVPVDGSEPARLFASCPKSESSPRWSPDGRRLAFLSDRGEDNQKQIWLMHADGGEAEKLTNAKAGVDSYKWSSDGRVIAFLARDGKTDDEQRSKNGGDDSIHIGHDYKYMRLWIIGLKERKSVLITRQNIEVADFDWSPDAASFAIAFSSLPDFEDPTLHLAVVRRPDGELLRKLTDNVSNVTFLRAAAGSRSPGNTGFVHPTAVNDVVDASEEGPHVKGVEERAPGRLVVGDGDDVHEDGGLPRDEEERLRQADVERDGDDQSAGAQQIFGRRKHGLARPRLIVDGEPLHAQGVPAAGLIPSKPLGGLERGTDVAALPCVEFAAEDEETGAPRRVGREQRQIHRRERTGILAHGRCRGS